MQNQNIITRIETELPPVSTRVVRITFSTSREIAPLFLPSNVLLELPSLDKVDEISLTIKIIRDVKGAV